MIVGYRDKRTRDFAAGKRVKAFSGIERAARLKLDRLESAALLKDLAHCRVTALRRCSENAKADIASALTISGGFALSGKRDRQGHRI